MIRFFALFLIVLPTLVFAEKAQKEAFYNDLWCSEWQGETEVLTQMDTRIDCLLELQAVETDFDEKWAEGLGQALHYSAMTGKKAAVLLIMKNHDGSDRSRFETRLRRTIEILDLEVDVFTIETKNYELRK